MPALKEYKTFYFEKVTFDKETLEISLNYSLDKEIYFEEKLKFNKKPDFSHVKDNELNLILQNMLLAYGISYYKTYCPKEMATENFSLTKSEQEFWQNFYEQGLGEFFFQNKMSPKGVINFKFDENKKPQTFKMNFEKPRFIVPIGGGKDSILASNILISMGIEKKDIATCISNTQPLVLECVKILGLDCVDLSRTLSPNIFELNKQGALNGHIPITGCIYFLMLFIAYVYKFSDVTFALENSASEPQAYIEDFPVNHQYSKSIDFERSFAKHIAENISPSFNIYSILRPFNELKIVEIFAKSSVVDCTKHFESFSSCNKNFKIQNPLKERWCQNCPKCAFVFLLFAPYLTDEKLKEIFGSNLFYNENLNATYAELIGLCEHRPFECVGSLEESIASCYMIYKQKRFLDSNVIQRFTKEILATKNIEYFEALEKKVLSFQDNHIIQNQEIVNFLKTL